MGKTISASQMLSAGRKRPPSPAETGTEVLGDKTSKPLDDQSSERLGDVTSSAVADQSSKPLDDQSSERLGDVTSSAVADQSSKPLDDQSSERLGDVTSSAVADQSSKPLDDQSSERLGDVTSSAVADQSSKPLDDQSKTGDKPGVATYQRVTVFLTPAQRQWLKVTAKQLPDGLSGSDIVRLALSRLAQDVTGGLDLIGNLTDQAHSDAEVFSGRRNRGLPPRIEIDA